MNGGEPIRTDLERLQRWIWAVITHPGGVEAGLQSEEARAEIPVSTEQLEQVILPSQTQTSLQRLGVYANAYNARLLECLREEYPILAQTLGQETFDAFAFGYLQSFPPRSYTLAELGRHFSRYLAQTQPHANTEDHEPGWADFLVDLATLERCYSEVFDGPGIENHPGLDAAQLSAIPPDRWPQLMLVPAPCLRLLTLRFPVHEYITAMRRDGQAPIPSALPTHLVITRRNYVVRRATVTALEFQLLQLLVAGEPVGEAISHAIASEPAGLESLERCIATWFQEWARAGYFVSVRRPSAA